MATDVGDWVHPHRFCVCERSENSDATFQLSKQAEVSGQQIAIMAGCDSFTTKVLKAVEVANLQIFFICNLAGRDK